ncbi:FUSC family protein [Phyllobacterium salinisoli]|uniref:FUSC family protein n=1 Tax=Phyllobacterium salinisoli TaxID=1899321 RepID=A0A368K8M8_9HYPH|nr:FUSC family protein [Phyllobacterium salinisoli]RCS25581.1 FUSC family protein [Phyllobacterium salinisoli]
MVRDKPSIPAKRPIDKLTLEWRAFLAALSDRDTLRRAVLCLIPTGGPIVVGAAMGQAEAGLIGGVTGLLLYFADADGGLRQRFSILALCSAGLFAGVLAGHLLENHQALFWIVFAASAFAAGFLYRVGKAQAMAMRLAALAMIVSAGIAQVDPHLIVFALGGAALVAVTRLADQWLFGPLPQLRSPVGMAPPMDDGWARFALAYASAAVAGLWIGMELDPRHALWVVVTTMLVMQPDAHSSYVRVVERTAGTFAGVMGAWLVVKLFGSPALLCVAVVFLSLLTPHHFARRYWLHTAVITALILIAYDLIEFGSNHVSGLLVERVQDMLVGSSLAVIATAAAFPREKRLSEDTPPRRKRKG